MLGIEEKLFAEFRIAGQIGFPRDPDRGASQAAQVGDDLGDLFVLQLLAQLFHRCARHTVLDDARDVLVLVAVQPAVVGQVGPFASPTAAAMTAAAQTTEQRLAFLQGGFLFEGQFRCGRVTFRLRWSILGDDVVSRERSYTCPKNQHWKREP